MLVLSGRLFYRGRLEPAQVGIERGKIVSIRKVLRGDEVRDFGDALLLPGAVDMHVHLRDPGLREKEDFPNGTRAAALGGVTTIADMPNTRPPVTNPSALAAKMAALAGRANVDYALYAAPRDGPSVARLEEAIAFKIYMAESTGGLQIDPHAQQAVLRAAADAGRLTVAHAEDAGKFRKTDVRGLEGHHLSRPKDAEVAAIRALETNGSQGRLHIAHVTCTEALDAVPPGITVEATPHHLLLDYRRELGAFGKVNPPLRSPEDREALWKAFVEGRIEVLASDHAPHTQEEKEGSFAEAPSGLPGVATALPLLLRRVKAGDLSLERLVAVAASRPAEVLGIAKGILEVGRDADLVVVDPRRVERVTPKRVRYKCGWTPFAGMEACFPICVYLRGEPVVEDGEPSAETRGRLITPSKR